MAKGGLHMFREFVLGVGQNPLVEEVVTRYGMRWGAQRFVAGYDLAQALAQAKKINQQGILVTLDHLGEAVKTPEGAEAAKESYLTILDRMHENGVKGNVSLKLTMLGLAIDPALARAHCRAIVSKAQDLDNFVRIDMEESHYTDITLKIFDELVRDFPGHVGTVIQAYLYRSRDDLRQLSTPPKNFRIVKGAYREPVAVAFPAKADVDENYFQLVTDSLELGNYTAIATHDEQLIGRILKYIHEQHVPTDQFEFQMLYGVKFSVLKALAEAGYRARVYVPFGRDWYPYYVRRIAERPANLLFFLRALSDRS
jgi:proline dehydrogenase